MDAQGIGVSFFVAPCRANYIFKSNKSLVGRKGFIMTEAAIMKRGDVYFTYMPYNTFNPTQTKGKHFYVILSNNKSIEKQATVQAVPLTSKTNKVKFGEKVVHLDGFEKPSKILGTQLSLFPKAAFLCGRKIGSVSKENMKEIEDCLREQLSLNTESEGR